MAVYQLNVASSGALPVIGYARYNRVNTTWDQTGTIPYAELKAIGDPVIAADPVTGNFVAVANGFVAGDPPAGNQVCVAVSRWKAVTEQWSNWTAVTPLVSGTGLDKPWIVAGEYVSGVGQEFYITYTKPQISGGARYGYARSVDGGETWTTGDVTDGLTGPPFPGVPFAMHCTVAEVGPLYAAYVHHSGSGPNGLAIRFLKGVDQPDGRVEFSQLMYPEPAPFPNPPNSAPLEVTLRHLAVGDLSGDIPGGLAVRTVPWLVADPTRPTTLYLVYHDRVAVGMSDVDIFMRRIKKPSASSPFWAALDPVRVNDDDPDLGEFDQFTPTAAVGSDGRLHITYYDDRRHAQDDDTSSAPRFDFFYTFTDSAGSAFLNSQRMYGPNQDEPELDYQRLSGWVFPDRPGEYNGIGIGADGVWLSFTGTSELKQSGSNPSVIWSVRP